MRNGFLYPGGKIMLNRTTKLILLVLLVASGWRRSRPRNLSKGHPAMLR
jgi:hypothetical protein